MTMGMCCFCFVFQSGNCDIEKYDFGDVSAAAPVLVIEVRTRTLVKSYVRQRADSVVAVQEDPAGIQAVLLVVAIIPVAGMIACFVWAWSQPRCVCKC